jgi:hypothetical protein
VVYACSVVLRSVIAGLRGTVVRSRVLGPRLVAIEHVKLHLCPFSFGPGPVVWPFWSICVLLCRSVWVYYFVRLSFYLLYFFSMYRFTVITFDFLRVDMYMVFS